YLRRSCIHGLGPHDNRPQLERCCYDQARSSLDSDRPIQVGAPSDLFGPAARDARNGDLLRPVAGTGRNSHWTGGLLDESQAERDIPNQKIRMGIHRVKKKRKGPDSFSVIVVDILWPAVSRLTGPCVPPTPARRRVNKRSSNHVQGGSTGRDRSGNRSTLDRGAQHGTQAARGPVRARPVDRSAT